MFQSTFSFTLNSSGLTFYKPISIAFNKAALLALNLGGHPTGPVIGTLSRLYHGFSQIPAVRIYPPSYRRNIEVPAYRRAVALLQNHTRALAF